MRTPHTSSGKNTVTDILIVGAGPTGLLAAVGLARRGWSVEVWDKASLAIKPSQKEKAAQKKSSQKGWGVFITRSTCDDITHIIGQLSDVPMAAVRRFSLGDIASGKIVTLGTPVEAEEPETPFGWGIDTAALRAYLLELIATDKTISDLLTLREHCTPEHVTTTQTGCLIRSKSGEQVRVGLMIVADGRLSQSRALCGLKATTRPFGQSALLVRMAHTSLQPDHGLELYDTDGPAVFLPMPDGTSTLTWVGAGADMEALASLDDTELADILQGLMPDWMGDISEIQSRMVKPLVRTYTENPVARRAVAIGDAANGLHPLFAQGFNLAVRDVSALCEHLGQNLDEHLGQNLGQNLDQKKTRHMCDPTVQQKLTKYARARHYDHIRTQFLTTFASKGLSATGPLGAAVRAGVPTLLSRFTRLQSVATKILGGKNA